MGALDSKAFSGTAVIAALLFVVSAVLVLATDDGIVGDPTKYALLIAGIFALIYAFSMFQKEAGTVRKAEGAVLVVTGVLFAVTCFMDTPGDFVAYDGVLAFVTIILALLAYWMSGTYGAMYVAALFAAFEIAMAAYCIFRGYEDAFAAVIFTVFAIFLVVDFIVNPYLSKASRKKTREVIDTPRAEKQEKAQAKNKKATPKAKKAVSKAESKPVEPGQAPEKKPVKAAEVKAPVEESKPVEPAPAPERKEQKRPDKATGEFMEKLMRSQDANRAAKDATPKAEPAAAPAEEKPVRTVELPKSDVLEAEKAKAVEAAPAEPAAEIVESPADDEAPGSEPAPVEESKPVEAPVEEDAHEPSVISEPIPIKEADSEFRTKEPDWGHVSKDSAVKETAEKTQKAQAVDEGADEAIKAPEAPVEEAPVEKPETAAEPVESEPEPAEAQEVPVESEATEEVSEQTGSVIDTPIEKPVEAAYSANPDWSSVTEESEAEEPEDPELGVDLYTDNSPEALVRRAAWNKGLRCRRNYGERQIPVAFVKGKVAVYVTEPGADASGDDALREEGWTVLRFDSTKITDGKAEGEEIAAAVKANVKAVKKRKARR